jgi:Ulp1 family protease
VHTIDDEQAPEPVHSADEKFVAVYQPAGRVLTTIYENDLATLGPTEMLNDTIVDFYMNYTLNEIIPAER